MGLETLSWLIRISTSYPSSQPAQHRKRESWSKFATLAQHQQAATAASWYEVDPGQTPNESGEIQSNSGSEPPPQSLSPPVEIREDTEGPNVPGAQECLETDIPGERERLGNIARNKAMLQGAVETATQISARARPTRGEKRALTQAAPQEHLERPTTSDATPAEGHPSPDAMFTFYPRNRQKRPSRRSGNRAGLRSAGPAPQEAPGQTTKRLKSKHNVTVGSQAAGSNPIEPASNNGGRQAINGPTATRRPQKSTPRTTPRVSPRIQAARDARLMKARTEGRLDTPTKKAGPPSPPRTRARKGGTTDPPAVKRRRTSQHESPCDDVPSPPARTRGARAMNDAAAQARERAALEREGG